MICIYSSYSHYPWLSHLGLRIILIKCIYSNHCFTISIHALMIYNFINILLSFVGRNLILRQFYSQYGRQISRIQGLWKYPMGTFLKRTAIIYFYPKFKVWKDKTNLKLNNEKISRKIINTLKMKVHNKTHRGL